MGYNNFQGGYGPGWGQGGGQAGGGGEPGIPGEDDGPPGEETGAATNNSMAGPGAAGYGQNYPPLGGGFNQWGPRPGMPQFGGFNPVPTQVKKKKKKKSADGTAGVAPGVSGAAAAPTPPAKEATPLPGAADWPPSLKNYVSRCFSHCVTDIDKDMVEILLKGKITAAAGSNSLWTKNWDDEPLPAALSKNAQPLGEREPSELLTITRAISGKVQGDLGSQGKVVRAGGFGANNKGTFGQNRNMDR